MIFFHDSPTARTAHLHTMAHKLRNTDSINSNSTDEFDFVNDCN